VQEAPLFAVNRILPIINEAVFVLQEGIAFTEDIDKKMMLGANNLLGHWHWTSLIGFRKRCSWLRRRFMPRPMIRNIVLRHS
jgi:3-hydroxyacyl-CoA dehydrogenase